jgi:hypothetical protein
MEDRELLEMAAKAAGYKIEWVRNSGCFYRCEEEIGREEWNPLDDDGDAFRLLISCCFDMVLDCYPEKSLDAKRKPFRIRIWSRGWIKEDFDGSTAQAISTRRAIVRAAAEIGKAVP